MPDLQQYFEIGLTYDDYLTRFEADAGNPDYAEHPLHKYTKLNWARHKRVERTWQTNSPWSDVSLPNGKALIISEPWCGDAAQNVPPVMRICEALNLPTRLILRDTNPELIESYLTNGGKSIPKVVFFDQNGSELGVWGPRPSLAQEMVMHNKHVEKLPYDEFSIKLQKWYNNDAGASLENELFTLLKNATTND